MSNVQNNSAKEMAKTAVPSQITSSSVLELIATEIKQPKSMQEVYKNAENLNSLLKSHAEYTERLKMIREFSDLIKDDSACTLVISHHTSAKTIRFTHLEPIKAYVFEQYKKGEKTLEDLETNLREFSM